MSLSAPRGRAIWRACWACTVLAEGRSDAPPAAGHAAASQLGQILQDPARRLLVAVADYKVTGAADVTVVTNLTPPGQAVDDHRDVIVSDRARGRGIGTALMDHASELARQAGCYKIQLLSGKQRADAHRFYRRLGFHPAAEGFAATTSTDAGDTPSTTVRSGCLGHRTGCADRPAPGRCCSRPGRGDAGHAGRSAEQAVSERAAEIQHAAAAAGAVEQPCPVQGGEVAADRARGDVQQPGE